jgi:hypothetical protein
VSFVPSWFTPFSLPDYPPAGYPRGNGAACLPGWVSDTVMDFDSLYSYLPVAQVAFTVWMLVDAYRRQAEAFWYWVILLVQPFGAWVYFFAVKIHDFRGLKGFSFQRRPSVGELRYRAEQTPTLTNHLALAQRLIEGHLHAEARPHLEKALALEPDHCQVLYSLAVCASKGGNAAAAVPLLERVLARDRCWSDYAAWRLLVEVRSELGDGAGALSACRDLARLAPTLQHRCLLAQHLLEGGLDDEADRLLQQALEDYHFAPGPARRRNRRWASEARRLQKQVYSR